VEVTTVERDRSEVSILTEDAANNLAKDDDVVLVEEKPANVDPQAIRTAGESAPNIRLCPQPHSHAMATKTNALLLPDRRRDTAVLKIVGGCR